MFKSEAGNHLTLTQQEALGWGLCLLLALILPLQGQSSDYSGGKQKAPAEVTSWSPAQPDNFTVLIGTTHLT